MRRALSGFASLIALTVFFVGLPVGLYSAVGWPVPTLSTIRSAVELHYLPGHLVAQVATCVALACWAWLLVAVLRMGVDTWRDRAVRPAAGAAWLLPTVRRSVAAVTLCAALLSHGTAWAGPTDHRVSTNAVMVVTTSSAVVDAPPQPTAGNSGPAAPAHIAAVGHRQSDDDEGRPTRVSTGQHRSVATTTQSTNPRRPAVTPALGAPTNGVTAAGSPATPAAAAATYRVQPRDVLWTIAANQCHDPLKWSQIAQLNLGRVMTDSNGGRRVFTNPRVILPGWELLMPSGWSPAPTPPAGSPVGAGPAPTANQRSAPGVTSPAPVTPAPGLRAPAAIGPQATPAAPSTTSPAPTAPAPAAAVAAPAVTAPDPTPPRGGAGRPTTRAARSAPARARIGMPGWLAPAGAGGATLLATWAFVEARRRRARRMRQSRPGFVMPPSDPTVAPLTTAVCAASDVAGVDRLHAALYHLATIGDRTLRPVIALRHPDGRVDVQLFRVAEPVPPWTATDRLFWTLAATADLPDVDPLITPCPALVQLGLCDDGAQLFADLEAMGILGLTGTAETVRQVARALTATLAVSPATQLCRVLTLGFDSSGLGDVEDRFVVAKSVEALLHEAEMTAKVVVRGIAERDAGSSFRLRAMDPDCGWEPTLVVVAGTALASDEVARLERLAGDGGQGAGVVCAGAEAAWNLELVDPTAGWWQLNPLGQRVRPVQMAAEELRELAAYLADADVEPVEMPLETGRHPLHSARPVGSAGAEEPPKPGAEAGTFPLGSSPGPVGSGDIPAARPPITAAAKPDLWRPAQPAMSEYVEAEWVVMIRLFGPPDAVNRSGVGLGDIGRGKPLELLAWLVTHRDVATRDGAREALWGGDDVAARTMSNALWGARTLLRKLADEPNEEFITSSNGRLQLSGKVVSDYERVADRLAFARRPVAAAAATEALDGGLHLVRGAPLAGEKWLWADENHLSTNLAMLGSAIATELAAQRLKAGQTDTAIEATTVGLEVIPNNEELIRLRMQACIDGGDRRAALNVYEKYVGATTARGESIGPEIAALRNELLRTGRK